MWQWEARASISPQQCYSVFFSVFQCYSVFLSTLQCASISLQQCFSQWCVHLIHFSTKGNSAFRSLPLKVWFNKVLSNVSIACAFSTSQFSQIRGTDNYFSVCCMYTVYSSLRNIYQCHVHCTVVLSTLSVYTCNASCQRQPEGSVWRNTSSLFVGTSANLSHPR